MRPVFVTAILICAAACTQKGPDTITPAPVAEVTKQILPPDMETAAGNNKQME